MPRPWAVEASRSKLNSCKHETPRDEPVASFGLFEAKPLELQKTVVTILKTLVVCNGSARDRVWALQVTRRED